MQSTLNYWKFFAGLGLFLYGMLLVETNLKELAGKRFKLFLRKYTSNRIAAIINGALATAFLQSSSIILLMVIAFAGAGIISLSNSLGIILGANLGTTITGWIVSYLGFKTSLESFIYPMIGIGSLGLIFINRRYLVSHLFGFIVGIGLLFMGLDFMKSSMSELGTMIDIKELQTYGPIAFYLFGFIVTAIIHSSSGMMTITLSALFANIISLESALFIVVGADLGTTMTALLASSKGSTIKKRVGLAHFLFNVGTGLIALVLMSPILFILQEKLQITDPLYTVVAFHTSFNLLGVIVFMPFLGQFEKFLNKRFLAKDSYLCKFIHQVSTEIPEASLEVIRLELRHFIQKVYRFNMSVFGRPTTEEDKKNFSLIQTLLEQEETGREYVKLKQMEGEILDYASHLQSEKLDIEETHELNKFIEALRFGVQSAKAMKDIQHNIKEFSDSVEDSVEEMMKGTYEAYGSFHKKISHIWAIDNQSLKLHELELAKNHNDYAFKEMNHWIYQGLNNTNKDVQIATFLNVNREIYIANSAFLDALHIILLSPSKQKEIS